MKKLLKILICIIVPFFSLVINEVAYWIDFSVLNSKETNCPVSNKNDIIYIPNGVNSYNTKISDVFWANTDRYIANAWSLAKLWQANNWLVSCWTWNRYSEVAPWDNIKVISFASDCTFNKVNVSDKNVQFVFNVRHWQIWWGSATVNKQYYTVSWWFQNPASLSYKTYSNYFVSNYLLDWNECYNLRIAWCWDWVLESSQWEQCDDWNNNNWDGCNAVCQREVNPPVPGIDINKVDANPADLDWNVWNDTQTVNIWSWAIFRIRATNIFTESLRNIVFTDTNAPDCAWNVTLPSTFPSTWSGVTVWWSWDHTNSTLEYWEYIDYTCSRANTSTWYTNSATVTWIWVTSWQSVTDTDTTVVLIPWWVWINCWTAWWQTYSSSQTDWPTWTTFCSSWATPNPNPPIFPAQNWSTSWTCNWTWSTISCNASRSWPWGWGWWWGWWSWPSCVRISIPSLEAAGAWKAISITGSLNVVCYWSSSAINIWIDCDSDWNWATKSITEQKLSTTSWSLRAASFTCTYNNLNAVPHPKCYVTWGWWTVTTNSASSLACSTWLSVWRNRCWDWVVQRPNSDWMMEECEAVNWVFPSWCIDCKTTNFTIPVAWWWVLTYPYEWNVFIKPFWQVIIWAWRNPFSVFGIQPLIWNNSSVDIYLNYPLCVHNTDSSVILRSNDTWLTKVCTTQNIWWLYPWVTKTYESLNYWNGVNIKWVKITNNLNYKDTILTTTLWDFKDSFFAAQLKVRVSKPAVATVWGWTSLIKNNNVTADINKVAWGWYSDPNKNKNFVWAWVSTWSVSSYSKSVDKGSSVSKLSSWQTEKTQKNLTKVTTTKVTSNKNIWDTLSKYNGLSNVFIVKNWDLTVNASISWSWARTYVVEWWNLYINQNITYSDNIAFVVKWWNIIIASNVTKINWTFISIKVAWVGWKITSAESDNQLVVNWSLYGDIENLVNNRTYIQNKNDLINVWTIVSFWSNLFRKQAPLVWDFIWEYVESKKIAK